MGVIANHFGNEMNRHFFGQILDDLVRGFDTIIPLMLTSKVGE